VFFEYADHAARTAEQQECRPQLQTPTRGLRLLDARFYDLRHTCASFLLAQGVEPRVVMEILGHAQYSFTMKTYAHVLPAMRQEAASRMDRLLRR